MAWFARIVTRFTDHGPHARCSGQHSSPCAMTVTRMYGRSSPCPSNIASRKGSCPVPIATIRTAPCIIWRTRVIRIALPVTFASTAQMPTCCSCAEDKMRVLIVSLVLVSVAWAQPPVAPAPQTAGIQQGENVAGYNIVDNFETGYRFRTLDGSLAQYRSSVNFGSGIRLLGSFLSVSSRNGRGRWFDQVVVTTQGLGNDPYEAATLRIEKNRLYRYDMLWR